MRSVLVSKRVRGGLACVALLSGLASPVHADEVYGERSELLVEKSHFVDLTLHAGHAKLVVRRTVHNGGSRHDEATFLIDVPEGAVATGLRTLGALNGQPRWFEGDLLEAEAAAEKYRELTGVGAFYPKDPALLSWRHQGLLALEVFLCAPRADKTVEYTLTVPTTYRDGAHHLSLPPLGTDSIPAVIRPKSGEPGSKLLVNGAPAPSTLRPARGSDLDFALGPARATTLEGEFVQSEFAPGRVLTRYAVRAAPRLSEVPRGAFIALVLDTSRSTDSAFLDAARVALDGYLSHFEGAQVTVLLFDRKLERPFGDFEPVARARTNLAGLSVRRRNGSDVDLALAEADQLLARTPRGAARRIVLLTDGLTRSNLSAERLRAATLKSGAVTHIGLLQTYGTALVRDDEHPWAKALERNHGLVWRASATGGADPSRVAAVYEEWARPVRLHRFRLLTPDLELSARFEQEESELDEGQGVEGLLLTEQEAPFITVEGELWTERVTRTIMLDRSRESLWAALVFGSPLLADLTDDEMMTLALRGGAVSPVTSYLAVEPGVRPSTEGLEHVTRIHRVRAPAMRSAVACRLGGSAPALDRDEFLQSAIAADWRRCGGRPGEASVTLETTSAEIVSVEVDVHDHSDPLLADCLREAVWDLVLPTAFYEEWNTWTVYL